MPVAFDAATSFSKALDSATTASTTHTPTGTPRGVLVLLVHNSNSGNDSVSGVTYGGETLAEVTNSPLLKTTGETGGCYAYFLGTSVPTGAQTCEITTTAFTGVRATVITVTADADVEVNATDAGISSDSVLDPSAVIALGGVESFVAMAAFSGEGVDTNVAPLSGWTSRDEFDFTPSLALAYTYDTVGTADVTYGFDSTASDDALALAVALSEVSGGGSTILPLLNAYYG